MLGLGLCMMLETEKLLSLEKVKQETEFARLKLQRQKLQLIAEGTVTVNVLLSGESSVFEGASGRSDHNDVSELRLPKFDERDPETFL